MKREELAAAIWKVARLKGNIRLRSGSTSSEYFDKYRFESDPRLLRLTGAGAGCCNPLRYG